MTAETSAEQVVVLGLDAADYRFAREWECENLLLENHAELTTEAFTRHHPYTLDLWPTMATGVHPEEHGLGYDENHDVEWENPLLRVGQSVADATLPQSVRTWIGAKLMDGSGAEHDYEFPRVDAESVFDAVYSWPGVDNADHLGRAWNVWHKVQAGTLTEDELERELMGLTRDELSWAAQQEGLVGTQMHVLDVVGHLYCRRPEELREWYERVDRLVGSYLDEFDETVILSDHGMQVEWLGDETPGDHSWHSLVSSTLDRPLPDHVLDVADWLTEVGLDADFAPADTSSRAANDDGAVTADTNMEQLRDLGYLD